MPGASVSVGTKRRASEPVVQTGSPAAGGGAGSNNTPNNSASTGGGASSTTSTSGASSMNGTAASHGGEKVKSVSSVAVMKMKAEVFEKDRENFLSAYEKPTQIYRFLRARMVESPIFLQRNLAYMKASMSRSHKSRIGFKVDSMLLKKQQKDREEKCRLQMISPRGGNLKGPVNFYNIILKGLTDGQIWHPDTRARIDVCIARVCLKKRKESPGPVTKVFEQGVDIKIFSPPALKSSNDISIPAPQKCPVISIPAEMCNLGTNGHTVRSYKLVMRVLVPLQNLQNKSSNGSEQNNHLNSRNNNSDIEEPKAKRRRSAPTKDRENFIYDGDSVTSSKNSGNGNGDQSDEYVIYTGNISLYDRDIPGDSIREVDFDLQLKRATKGGNKISYQRIRREITWENFDEKHAKVLEQARPAGKCAKVTVAIRTSSERQPQFVEPPPPLLCSAIKKEDGALDDSALAKLEYRKSVRVIYQFMFGTHSQQQTESRNDLRCPWCSINCIILYSLLKHLKLCHPRYQFSYAPIPNGAKIDITINDSYDGSYSGSAYDLVSQPPGEAFARNGPTKRTEVFSILVCRPKPMKQSLQEFFDCDEKDVDQRRTYITGHNRLYHHTSTCLPIHPREIDVDSEGEPDPEWLRVKTTMMIDEFTDVNEGEKELMKLWNLHVMKYNYVGDCQIPLACKRFVELHGKELIQKNLYRNFCLHLTNLFDFGLLTPQGVHNTVQLLHSQMKETNTAPSLRDSWKAHQQVSSIVTQPFKTGVNGRNSSPLPSSNKSFTSTVASSSTATSASPFQSNAKTAINNTNSSITASSSSTNNTANNSLSIANGLNFKVLKVDLGRALSSPSSSLAGTRYNSKN